MEQFLRDVLAAVVAGVLMAVVVRLIFGEYAKAPVGTEDSIQGQETGSNKSGGLSHRARGVNSTSAPVLAIA